MEKDETGLQAELSSAHHTIDLSSLHSAHLSFPIELSIDRSEGSLFDLHSLDSPLPIATEVLMDQKGDRKHSSQSFFHRQWGGPVFNKQESSVRNGIFIF